MVILGGIGAELLTLLFFWREHSQVLLMAWFLGILLLSVCRYVVLRRFTGIKLTADNYHYWGQLNLRWAVVWGLHWGILPVFIMQSEMSIYTMCVVIVYTGFTASSVSSSASHFPTFLAFSLPASISLVSRFLYEGGVLYTVLATMICFYYVINTILARNSERLFVEARELTFQHLQLTQELEIKKEAAESATRSKDRFLAAASHDLRQPLHASGLLLSALVDYVTHEKGKALLNDIHQTNQALNQSFTSLLDLSRLDAGIIKVTKTHFQLNNIVNRVITRVSPIASNKPIQLEVHNTTLAAYSDPIVVEQILFNLVSNAIDYTAKGRVTISAKKTSASQIRLLVSDTGIGIDNSELSEIFSEYYQIDNPERDRQKGFGLGLAIVSRLVEILESALYVSSEPQTGTRFALYLEAGESERIALASDEQQHGKQARDAVFVLVIDDDPAILNSMRALLESWEWDVLCAESAPHAIQQLESQDRVPDIIVADFRLRKNATGDKAILAIREEFNCDIPAIIVTGDTSKDRLLNLTTVGHKVLHKPVSPAMLRATIEQSLAD